MGHWTPTGIEPKDYDDDEHKAFKSVTFIKQNTSNRRKLHVQVLQIRTVKSAGGDQSRISAAIVDDSFCVNEFALVTGSSRI